MKNRTSARRGRLTDDDERRAARWLAEAIA
jgi:hypothetical protein